MIKDVLKVDLHYHKEIFFLQHSTFEVINTLDPIQLY